MTLLSVSLLIVVFAAGLTVGLQIQFIVARLQAAINALQHQQREKNSGVVRPGLGAPTRMTSDEPRRSAVIRPRPPKTDEDATNTALASARSRTGQ